MRNMIWIHAGLCTGLLLSGGAAFAQRSEPQKEQTERANPSDQEFLNRALRVNALELRLGHLASERGNSPDVKAKGQSMVKKHSDFGRQLSEQARREAVAETPELTAEQAGIVAELEQLSGPAFDTAFKQTIDRIHQQELAMYKDEATRASDPKLRAFAQARVQSLQKVLSKQPAQPTTEQR